VSMNFRSNDTSMQLSSERSSNKQEIYRQVGKSIHVLHMGCYAKRATTPASTPAALRTNSPPSRLWPFAVFVLSALVAAALDALLVLLAVLVTKLLPVREIVGDSVASLPVTVPESVVMPTDSIDAVGMAVVTASVPCWVSEVVDAAAIDAPRLLALVTNVNCPFASVET